jgi:hydroxyacylglutathione hydrolase
VGDIGRPDLLEKAAGMVGTQDKGAKQMYQSIKKFNALADYIQVWPGHGAGSACGKALGAVPSTTVGYEKARNWAFQYPTDETGFTEYLLADQPEPPKYFAMMKKLNKVNRPLLTEVPKLKKLSIEEVNSHMANGVKLLDARPKTEFAAGFIPGSLNIQGNNSFATWAGWFLTYEEPFMILADESMLDDLTRKLMRIGLDNIAGYLPSVEEYTQAGGTLEKVNLVELAEAKVLANDSTVQVVDLRGVAEFNAGHIKDADNVFVGTLPNNLDKISKDKKVMIHCQGGDRASIAYSILAKNGFKNIVNYSAGMNEWVNTGEPVVS